jgi:periplasmic protein TonB
MALQDRSDGTPRSFLTTTPGTAVAPPRHGAGALTVSLAAHGVLFLVLLTVVGRTPTPAPGPGPAVKVPLVWTPTLEGGGHPGGGGEKTPAPARRAQLVGREAITVPVASPAAPATTPSDLPEPTPRLEIPAVLVESGLQEAVGAVAELRPLDAVTRGPGSGPGADGGRGGGADGGDGNDLGTNKGAGFDGEGEQPGNGVSWPRLIREVKPLYTADAMRAQVEGLVLLEIQVLPDGSVGRVSIVRSLDPRFGLDQEAINAVRRWRFDPGRRAGKAIATRVGVELSFNLR